MSTTKLIKLLAVSLFIVGCGGSNSGQSSAENGAADVSGNAQEAVSSVAESSLPDGYTNTAINNSGAGVEGTMGSYTVKLYANSSEEVKPQEPHKGVVVKMDGQTSETMAIQESYIGKSIVAVVHEGDKVVKASSSVEVTDVPVVIIELD